MVSIAIYDRYLSTLGGGERYSCKMAEILSKEKDYKVDLLTDIYCDKKDISERLNLDLEDVDLKVFGYISDDYAKRITSRYDIFINATYLSPMRGYAGKNIYLCYFPTPFDVDFRFIHRFLLKFFRLPAKWLYGLSEKLDRGIKDESLDIIQGIYDMKRFMLKRGSWSNGDIEILVSKASNPVRLGFKNPDVLGSPESMDVCIKVFKKDDSAITEDISLKLARGLKEVIDLGLDDSREYLIRISSGTFYPEGRDKKEADTRRLGVVVYDERKTGLLKKALFKVIGFIPLFLVTYPKDLAYLDTYDQIIAISEYSKHWIKRLWDRESTLLFPPVDIDSFKPAKKEKIILSVGRFFPEHHNKKQLEMAEAFISMLEEEPQSMEGYSLYLMGGLSQRQSHRDYVDRIKHTSEGYPIKVLTNSSWEDLIEVFSRADIFWHSSGMGEEEAKNPERFEHFGITTVEAMAAGCIPVVIDKGGQKEIIDSGKDGFLFTDWKGLKKYTLDIIEGRVDREKIRENALKSCRKFSNEAFASRLLEIISGIME